LRRRTPRCAAHRQSRPGAAPGSDQADWPSPPSASGSRLPRWWRNCGPRFPPRWPGNGLLPFCASVTVSSSDIGFR